MRVTSLILASFIFCSAFAQEKSQPDRSFVRLWVLNGNGDVFVTDSNPEPEEIVIDLPGLPLDATPLTLVHIPAGSFMMGAGDKGFSWEQPVQGQEGTPSVQWDSSWEQPVHPVHIDYDFFMSKFEITQAQWLALMGNWPDSTKIPNAVYGQGDNHPAYFISWNDCQDFIDVLNQLGQRTFRLPSEAEWEYACRAKTKTSYYFGNSESCGQDCEDCRAGVLPGNRSDYMWYCGNNNILGSPGFGAKEVGRKLPNSFGLFDMHGNVYERCQDTWHVNYQSAPSDGSAWESLPGSAIGRVIRGGSWDNKARYCRSTVRNWDRQDSRVNFIGFRIVCIP